MSPAVRFAPSPTGALHLGNVRAAVVNKLFALRHGGSFLLRLDDTDASRSRPEYATAIQADLDWLGLAPDRVARQSDRLGRYEAAAERLRRSGRLYPCYETAEELERRRARQRQRHQPPVYDRAALRLDAGQRAALEAEGRRPHWRFRLGDGRAAWDDLVRGRVEIELGSLSDPVLVREDGTPLYAFCSVVDDIELAITHVLRGEDHVTNTAAQIDLFRALGAEPPAFGHFALLVGPGGEALSKREGSLALAALRDRGIEPMAVNSLLARLGTADPVEPRQSLEELAEGFDLSRFGRAAPRVVPAGPDHLRARGQQPQPVARAAARLAAMGLGGAGEAFWLAVRSNLSRLDETAQWWQVVQGPMTPVAEDPEYLATALRLLPAGPVEDGTWAAWTRAIQGETGRRGKALFQPLRLALTGRRHGPEMHNLLPLIGESRIRARLRGESA